ncbi:MAG: ImmA/IrrE family metallo-endopeptidase [Gemmatimonadaceae bacterium]|nr:ImmA/IrrE family metallo-endopeptidase [Gemmatimonadaceae bacterium]
MTRTPSQETKPNPQMVSLARESRGFTQIELAKELGVSQGYLSKVESDLLEPTPEVIHRLGKILDYPASFFYLSDPVYGPGITEFWHRKRQAATSRQMRQIYADINKRIIHIERLLRATEIPEQFSRLDPEEFDGPADIARAVRVAWHLPHGPVRDVTRTIERAGGIVVRCAFPTRLVDAVSRWVPGMPPLFFLNETLPADRERLTLAHELGHLVMHRVPSATMEDEAFEFAGEFLMPADEIRPKLTNLSLPRLASLKAEWRVSMAALILHAKRLGTITERQARYLYMQMGKAGYRQREPAELDFPKEEPRVLHELIHLHREDFGYSISDLSEWFSIYERELVSSYPIDTTVAEARHQLRAL